MEPPLSDSIFVDFLGRLLADREVGHTQTLAEYQALYPGHERAVEAEYRRVVDDLLKKRPASGDGGAQDAQSPQADGSSGLRVGHYRLLHELGRGGQGAVWLAFDERLSRRVALKIVPRSPFVEDLAPRFRREAQLAGRLDHPGICAVYDVGFDDSLAWIALRYVEGRTLAQRLAGGPLPRDEALSLIEGAARALHVAHEAGVIHRDVKPGNLMISAAGEPVLLDFGVARPEEDGPPLTLTGDAIGTPAYMAPEQLAGVSVSRARRTGKASAGGPDEPGARAGAGGHDPAGRRADVWALGVTLFEALVGRRPFDAPTREGLVRAIVNTEPYAPRELGRDLSVVLRTALAKEPDRRYRTALDLAEDLRRVRAREPILARPAGPLTRLLSWGRRNPGLAASVLALSVVIGGALVVTWVLLARTRETLADVTRLADLKVARDLMARDGELWPAVPEKEADLVAWLDGARAVLAREPLHREVLESTQAGTGVTDAWMAEQLGQLLLDLQTLRGAVTRVETRLDFARSVDRRTIEEPRAAWEAAAAAVAADPRFAGLVLTPQRGLIPLGADPDSGLQEFAHLQSGVPPTRDPGTRRLAFDQDSGLVFVLIPGGVTQVGAEPATDPWCGRWDGPIQTVALDPYLLSKFEMTQGQWLRHTDDNPSQYRPGSTRVDAERPLQHPVEGVTWVLCDRATRELGLALPTEAQWEHAARAGTSTPWWTGDQPESLTGAANIADRFAKEHEGHDSWEYVTWLDDGFTVHAPVGCYRANAFGLHDTAGNVMEWCRGTWEDWAVYHPRPGDGLSVGTEDAPAFRGGAFLNGAGEARSSYRNGAPSNSFSFYIGLRPARALPR